MIYLAQTDTTVGFLSDSKEELATAKKRDQKQPFIICVSDFKKLKKLTRIPKKYKNLVRRSKKTTFIYPNGLAIRVINHGDHYQFLKKFDFLFSTSANEHKKDFDLQYAMNNADIIIYPEDGFKLNNPSKIVKLNSHHLQYIRT